MVGSKANHTLPISSVKTNFSESSGVTARVIVFISDFLALSSVEEEVEKIEVLIAAQNIPGETQVETIIADGSVITQAIPRKYLAEGVLISLEDYKGYIAAVPINKGEQITATKLIKPEDIGLAFMIPDDMVAISIPVNE
ncbi:unnamed protein product, partial [marine sediment metagenome]